MLVSADSEYSNISPPQVREISNFKIYELIPHSRSNIMRWKKIHDFHLPYYLFSDLYSRSKCHSKTIFFPEKHWKRSFDHKTHIRNSIGLNDARSGNQTKFGTYSFDCESFQNGLRDITSLADRTEDATPNIKCFSFHSWPSSWNFIWINKSPLQKCIYSFATRSGAISVHETIYILTHCKHTQYTPCSQAVARTS